jgi:hypothetical protein
MMVLLRVLSFFIGMVIVAWTLFSAIETLVLPRSAPDLLTRTVFVSVRRLFSLRLRWARSYAERDRVLPFFAPISLLILLPTWLALVLIGYMGMFWGLGVESWGEAFRVSGSSLLTLGSSTVDDIPKTILVFSEATIGLILVAMLIAYLPTMYAAFSRRETAVTLLEVRANTPPSAVDMILRFNRIHGLDRLTEQWRAWETWFADIEESHTSLPALVFFRSPRPDRSWVTASGAVLDAAALTLSAVDIPADAQAALCIRAGTWPCVKSPTSSASHMIRTRPPQIPSASRGRNLMRPTSGWKLPGLQSSLTAIKPGAISWAGAWTMTASYSIWLGWLQRPTLPGPGTGHRCFVCLRLKEVADDKRLRRVEPYEKALDY